MIIFISSFLNKNTLYSSEKTKYSFFVIVCKILFFVISSTLVIGMYGSDAFAKKTKLYPIDEATKDFTFLKFRTKLIHAVNLRDASYLISILAPDVRGDFGSNAGIAEFKLIWHPERYDSPLWSILKNVLMQGGAFVKNGQFVAPYVASNFPDEYNSYEYAAIGGKHVHLRKLPNIKSEVLSLLSYDIVKIIDWKPVKGKDNQNLWLTIELMNGRKGYVVESSIVSPLGYRIYFEKKGNNWFLKDFVSGD